MQALRAEGLYKDFGGVHALRDVSFSVGNEERLAIIRPNHDHGYMYKQIIEPLYHTELNPTEPATNI